MVFDDFGSELSWQGLHKESPKSHASPEESFRNRHRSMHNSKRNCQCSVTQTALVSSNFVASAFNRNRKQHWYLPIWLCDKIKKTFRNLSSNSTQNWRFSGSKSWTTIPTPKSPNSTSIYRFCCAESCSKHLFLHLQKASESIVFLRFRLDLGLRKGSNNL